MAHLAHGFLSTMTHNKIVIGEKSKVSRNGAKTDIKTVRSKKQRLVSQPMQAVDGR